MFRYKRTDFPFIKQPGEYECGTACLAMIFKHYGYYNIRGFLSYKAQVSTEGIDLYTLSELAEGFGFESNGYQMGFDSLLEVTLPCIAHYSGNHFVVIYRCNDSQVWIADPATGTYTLNREEFEGRWNGVILELEPTPDIFQHNELTELAEFIREKSKNLISQFYLPHFSGAKKVLLQVFVGTIFLQFLGLALPFFTQTILDQALVHNNKKLLYAILVGMLVVFFSQLLISYGRNMLLAQFTVAFERAFFSRFFDHFIRLKQSFFDSSKREDFVNRFQENLRIRQALNPSVLEGFIDFFFVGIYLAALYYFSVILGVMATAFAFLYGFLSYLFFPKLKHLESRIFSENIATMGQFLDTLLGIQSVRLLGMEKVRYWKWKNQYTRALNKVLESEKTYINLSTILDGIFYFSQATMYWFGAYLAFSGDITIGTYIATIAIYAIIINALKRITQLSFMFSELSVTFDRINDVLVQDTVDSSLENKVVIGHPIHIKIENLYFKYRIRDERYALRNINLDIYPGEFVGIVGRNGSGKSTLIKLIAKLYEGYDGKILLNSCELQDVMTAQLRRDISIVPQDVYLFDGTLKENILYGNMEASDEQVIAAVKQAELYEFVEEHHLGLNLFIGESGANLSGGQRLKVAVARLFLSNPEIIILDEASSALDIETEKLIISRILKKFKGKTIISSAHRLQTLKQADKILVFEKGEICELGSHDELLEKRGLYFDFINTYINY